MGNCAIDRFEETVEYGEYFRIRVDGLSMLPLLGYGEDTIIIRRTRIDEPIEGRIAMYRLGPHHYITHRVVSVKDGIVTLLGDGRITYDDPIKRDMIVGVVDGVIRKSGRMVSCTSRMWRLRERIWLLQPMIMRRYSLALIRRWRRLTKKARN